MQNDAFDILTLFNPDKEPFDIVYNKEIHKTIQPGKAVRVIKMIGSLGLKHLVDRMCQLQGVPINNQAARDAWTKVILVDLESQQAPVPQTLLDQAKAMTEKLNQTSDLERFLATKALPNAADLPVAAPPTAPAYPVAPPVPAPAAPVVTPQNHWKFDPLTGDPITSVNPAPTPETTGITPESIDTSNVEVQVNDTSPIGAAMASIGNAGVPADPSVASILEREGAKQPHELPEVADDDTPAAPVITKPRTRENMLAFAKDTLMMNLEDPKTKAELDAMTDDQLDDTLKYTENAV